MGANVTLVARNQNRLLLTLKEMEAQRLNCNQKFNHLSGMVYIYHYYTSVFKEFYYEDIKIDIV